MRGSAPRPIIVKSTVEKSPNALMRGDARLEIVDLRHREGRVRRAEPRRALPDVDQPVFVAIDQRAQQHAADDAEDRGVGADAERERDHDGGGEALGAPQRAQGDAHVAAEGRGRVEPAAVPDAAHRLADGRNVAEFPQRREARGFGILAALDALLDAERQWPRISSSSSRSSGRMALLLRCAAPGS